jgi:hypothetical protein
MKATIMSQKQRVALAICVFVTLSLFSVEVFMVPTDWVAHHPWWLWRPVGALLAGAYLLLSAVQWLRTR